MNWRWKARIQNTVAALPRSNDVYFWLQRSVGSLRPGRHNPLEWFTAAAQIATWIEETGRSTIGKSFLEVGTGRTIDLPLGLWLCGAGQVTTIDLNPYLSEILVQESLNFVKAHEQESRAALHGRDSDRLAQLANFDGDMDALMTVANIDYKSPADATKLDLPAASIDFHVSYAVFEHMPCEIIEATLSEARRVLRPDGLLLHVIDPSDHFSHDDDSITAINFLQFSEDEWRRLAGNHFMYHNRLRALEYVQLFEKAGFEILLNKQITDDRALSALQNGFRLDPRFQKINIEELAVRNITLVAGIAA
ncbi:MAG TPA: class I SAM-dependent methyltransferase [Pyrinomonadaceae bacterium]|nr:class I SAM-dependent methyltransferase [Pyrinomonadaceae bacterium]